MIEETGGRSSVAWSNWFGVFGERNMAIEAAKRHLMQLAPHVRGRETAMHLEAVIAEADRLLQCEHQMQVNHEHYKTALKIAGQAADRISQLETEIERARRHAGLCLEVLGEHLAALTPNAEVTGA